MLPRLRRGLLHHLCPNGGMHALLGRLVPCGAPCQRHVGALVAPCEHLHLSWSLWRSGGAPQAPRFLVGALVAPCERPASATEPAWHSGGAS